jgi:probable HAF family extracellular repeat protein
VGNADVLINSAYYYHAFRYSNGSMQDLGTLGGTTSSAAAINSSNVIVGSASTAAGASHAFIYNNGNMLDLNSLVTSSPLSAYVTLTGAAAINNNGWIAAAGVDSRSGQSHAYLLEPMPSGATDGPLPVWALGALGAGLLGITARRLRRAA